jgi:Domain of unknown function (DUF4160)
MDTWHQPFSARTGFVSFSSLVKSLVCMCMSIMQRGEAKYWLEPKIALAQNIGLSGKALKQAQALIEEHEHDIRTAWQQHFGS